MTFQKKYTATSLISGLTRIEMLIALYDRAIQHCQSFERDIETGNNSGATFHEFKAQKLICGIHAGIDQNGTELVDNLNRILEYCSTKVAERQPATAVHSLTILRDAWEQIREESNQLEAAGSIPPIAIMGTSMEVTV